MVAAAALAGIISGLLLTAVQSLRVIPILRQAELYEVQSSVEQTPTDEVPRSGQDTAWEPTDGWHRSTVTALTNIALATGFALLLGVAMSLRGEISGTYGAMWGIAGYAAFFIAPALDLPPEIPGAAAADVTDRQWWWTMVAVPSGLGLWLIAFARRGWARLFGVALLACPHLLHAPLPEIQGRAPAELAQDFVCATYAANVVFWLVLGSALGFFYNKMEDSRARGSPNA